MLIILPTIFQLAEQHYLSGTIKKTLIELKKGSRLHILPLQVVVIQKTRKTKTSSACHKSFLLQLFSFAFHHWLAAFPLRCVRFHSGLICPTLADLRCLMSSGMALESSRLLFGPGDTSRAYSCISLYPQSLLCSGLAPHIPAKVSCPVSVSTFLYLHLWDLLHSQETWWDQGYQSVGLTKLKPHLQGS